MERFFTLGIRVFKSASFISLIGTALRVGGGLITLPLALKTIPQAQMGLYYTFMAITGIAMLLDFGFAPAIGRNAAYAMGGAISFRPKGLPPMGAHQTPNWELLGNLKYAVQRWYWALSTILAIALLTAGSYFIKLQIEESELPSSLLLCWILFALSSAYNLSTIYWHDLLIGIGSIRQAARIGLLCGVINITLTVAGLLAGAGIWTYAIVSIIGTVIGRTLTKKTFVANTQPPSISPSKSDISNVFECLWPMAWRQGVVLIGAFLIQKGNTLVCATQLGMVDTASYGLSLNLLNVLIQVALIPLSLKWPEISRYRVQGNIDSIKRTFFIRLYGGLFVAVCGIFAGIFVLPILLSLIGSQTTILSNQIFLLLGLILILENHHSCYAMLVLSENRNPFILPALISGIAIFAASWWGASIYGILGLVAAQGIVQLAWNNWWTVKIAYRGLSAESQN